MPKTFYTERDIEDLCKRGVTSITVTEDVVLTELAREKAERLGVALIREHDTPPSAPIRPYIAKPTHTGASSPKPNATPNKADLREKVRQAVIARLGNEVDRNLLETIITRVLDNVGVK